MTMPSLYLKKHQERRLRAGHCWIYSNEIDIARSPIKDIEPGSQVEMIDHQGKWMGYGYLNPHTLLAVRLVSRDKAHPLDGPLIVHRINIALGLRQRLYASPYYRLIFGESDGLPGLVVDRFGDILVAQITTAGMERMKETLVAALDKALKPSAIILRNDTASREIEGLDRYLEVAAGKVPEFIQLREHDTLFHLPLQTGQKTGWFFDQADNRLRMHPYVKDQTVLDVFTYLGAWGVQAATKGASEVVCVDASADALETLATNAAANGVSDKVTSIRGDAFEVMKELRSERRKFNVVCIDPPAFIKRRKDFKEGSIAYRRINQLALQLVEKDGILISSSCSHHMSEAGLLGECQQAARATDRFLQLLERGQQGRDHPVHPAISETAYLKSLFFRVLPSLC